MAESITNVDTNITNIVALTTAASIRPLVGVVPVTPAQSGPILSAQLPLAQPPPNLANLNAAIQPAHNVNAMNNAGEAAVSGSLNMGVAVTSRAVSSPYSTSNTQPEAKILDKKRLADLVKEVDPCEQLDEDVEEMLMMIADDFIDSVVNASCQIAKHRKANSVEVKDVQLHLERNWNMWIPGFGSEEIKTFKKSVSTEAHKQRLALIRKTLKKF